MTSSFTTAELRDTVTMLSSPALIRLVTEIDDNGPIPPRGMARTFADLPVHQLRQSTDAARALNLVRGRPGAGLGLTAAGVELADVYDACARWARRHACPTESSDFTSRVQHTLSLMSNTLHPVTLDRLRRGVQPPGAQAAADLVRPHDLLRQWLTAYPQAARLAAPEPAA
ncbi:hypothetical protein A6A06_01405 [Streptomyces sp. CB02923]|uniref:hypothetical protein n=1 Tax=Streptomyces sp. CB02923 TaxID=1718985 RepID=UPI0009686DB9|nr:hypothetical protein [Streptomyces sp. CB02923]OKI09394.1 hypothetical protein A6A06_01405 [Streptomyces sp. CB02923]